MRRRFRRAAPGLQLCLALVAAVGGAWLVGMWMVGVVVMLAAVGVGLDAVFRNRPDDDTAPPTDGHEAVLDRWRRAR